MQDVQAQAGKLAQPSNKLVEKKLRLTAGQVQRLKAYQQLHPGKKEADALRDLFNAGTNVLLPAKEPG